MKYLDFTDLFASEPADIALLSTFQLHPDYFEKRLLHSRCPALAKARRILVCMDAGQWFSLLGQDVPARLVNRRYLVLPVHRQQGVFHSKLNLLLSEKGAQVQCGSNNLTRSGCSSNFELLNAINFDQETATEEALLLAQGAFGFFQRACNDAEAETARIAREWLAEAETAFPWLTQPVKPPDPRRVALLHTYEGGLWERLASTLDKDVPTRLLVISPFHDLDGEMFRRVHRRWPKCGVEVLVQQGFTNLPVASLKKLGSVVSLSELCDSSRRLHAKLVAWQSEKGSGCLVGSANFTTAAFDGRNVEACFLVSEAEELVQSLFDEDLVKRTIKVDDFDPGSEEPPEQKEVQTARLRLVSAVLVGNEQLRVTYQHRLESKPASLQIAFRSPGEPLPRALAGVRNIESYTESVPLPPAVVADSHSTIMASLVAEFSDHQEESDPVWVIQEDRLTYEPGGDRCADSKKRVEETGEGLNEYLEEIGKREGVSGMIDYLKHTTIRFHDGSSRFAFGRKFRIRIRDPFHPDMAPEWLIHVKGQSETLDSAIGEFVERHERRRLRRHASRGNINGMENFLDIFTAMVRVLYVYYTRGFVKKGRFLGHVYNMIQIATGGSESEDDSYDGYLLSIHKNLSGNTKLLQEASDNTHFAAEIRAALLIAQKVRFVPNEKNDYGSPARRPRECLPTLARTVRDSFGKVGLGEPPKKDILEALERYRIFTNTELSEFWAELEA
jgi:hypothetical protein